MNWSEKIQKAESALSNAYESENEAKIQKCESKLSNLYEAAEKAGWSPPKAAV